LCHHDALPTGRRACALILRLALAFRPVDRRAPDLARLQALLAGY
jgi:hypothetical protein